MFWETVVHMHVFLRVALLALRQLARAIVAQLQEMWVKILVQLAPREVSLLACEFASQRLLCLAGVRAFWVLELVVL
jgi:hypothetical protein